MKPELLILLGYAFVCFRLKKHILLSGKHFATAHDYPYKTAIEVYSLF